MVALIQVPYLGSYTVNATTSRRTGKTPFEIMTGLKMRNKKEIRIIEILEEQQENARMKDLEIMFEEVKKNIQEGN